MSTALSHHGFDARVIDYAANRAEDDFQAFLASLASWYRHHLCVALGEDAEDIIKAHPELLFTTEAHLAKLLDAGWRKKHVSKELSKAVRAGFDGNGNAQFHPWKGWRFSGFGITNHMRGLACAFDAHEPAARVLADVLGCPRSEITVAGMPHPLVKPPSRNQGLLKPHVDGGVTLRTIQRWAAETESAAAWARCHGVQNLVHLRGATFDDSGGHTIGLCGLSVVRYYVLLSMLCPDHPHPAAPEVAFDSTDGGPIFAAFFDHRKESPFLKQLNHVLAHVENGTPNAAAAEWLASLPGPVRDKVARCRASPQNVRVQVARMCPTTCAPYLATWLLGYPHGSTPTGPVSRLTINLSMQRGYNQTGSRKRRRGCERALNLVADNFAAVVADKDPYEGGIVHRNPAIEVDNYPYFSGLYASPQQINAFADYCNHQEAALLNPVPDLTK
jgi:hypothetical protein